MMNISNGLCNGMWDLYQDDRASGFQKSQFYDPFFMRQTVDGYPGYPKEQMRQTMLKQDLIFRHQLQELHRLYKRQRDLMNEVAMKEHYNSTTPAQATTPSYFLSRVSSRISEEIHTQRRVIDLELPADVDDDNEGKQADENVHYFNTTRAYNLADLNEPIQVEAASFSWNQNTSTINHNRWIGSSDAYNSNSRSKISVPHWLMATKEKETMVYQMNLDSLQHHSHQFFKKSETITSAHGPKVQFDLNTYNLNAEKQCLIKEDGENNRVSESRHHIDLNLSFDEDDSSSTPYIPESVVKIALTEIDLEAPALLESETDRPGIRISNDVSMDAHEELVKSAAEAIISISSHPPQEAPPPPPPPPADTLLRWLAEVIASGDGVEKESANVNEDNDECIPEDMDYFEYMPLKLQETKEHHHRYTAAILEENEEDDGLWRKRAIRKGQGKRGKQRKDFQRDVLPGIVSLSRREVTEDLQTFEEAFTVIGVSWQSKRKSGGKNVRGQRRLVVPITSSHTPSPPPAAAAVEQSVCREEEKSLGGWGKRTRRLPRQRCQNGGNHQSLALKC